jgi:hypothetical protein
MTNDRMKEIVTAYFNQSFKQSMTTLTRREGTKHHRPPQRRIEQELPNNALKRA